MSNKTYLINCVSWIKRGWHWELYSLSCTLNSCDEALHYMKLEDYYSQEGKFY